MQDVGAEEAVAAVPGAGGMTTITGPGAVCGEVERVGLGEFPMAAIKESKTEPKKDSSAV